MPLQFYAMLCTAKFGRRSKPGTLPLLRGHYGRGLATKAEAKKWFAVKPARSVKSYEPVGGELAFKRR